jgi:hypothetical protein
MIVRLTFEKDGEQWQMLFGNSYKGWHTQMIEYVARYFCSKDRGWNKEEMLGHIRKVEVSKAKWIGWGGLKWCSHENFQAELNREGVQQDEPDNPKPRQYSRMKFEEKPISFAERHLEDY